MPVKKQHHVPIDELDAAARKAFKAVVARDGTASIAAHLEASPRTVERIANGLRDVPPGMALDLAEYLLPIGADDFVPGSAEAEWFSALGAWARSREGRG